MSALQLKPENERMFDTHVIFFAYPTLFPSPILFDDAGAVEVQVPGVHPQILPILDQESKVPWIGLGRCVVLGVVVLLCSLFKGGQHSSVIGVHCGNSMYMCFSFALH